MFACWAIVLHDCAAPGPGRALATLRALHWRPYQTEKKEDTQWDKMAPFLLIKKLPARQTRTCVQCSEKPVVQNSEERSQGVSIILHRTNLRRGHLWNAPTGERPGHRRQSELSRQLNAGTTAQFFTLIPSSDSALGFG